jgi:hypothetical protein
MHTHYIIVGGSCLLAGFILGAIGYAKYHAAASAKIQSKVAWLEAELAKFKGKIP